MRRQSAYGYTRLEPDSPLSAQIQSLHEDRRGKKIIKRERADLHSRLGEVAAHAYSVITQKLSHASLA